MPRTEMTSPSKPKTMRVVVCELRASGAEALLELLELEHAVRETLACMTTLAHTARLLTSDAERFGETGAETPLNGVRAPVGRAREVCESCEQIVAAFTEVVKGIRSWGVDRGANEDDVDDGPAAVQRTS